MVIVKVMVILQRMNVSETSASVYNIEPLKNQLSVVGGNRVILLL